MDAVLQLSSTVGIESACDALGVARASFYRQRPLLGPALSSQFSMPRARPIPARSLNSDERESVLAVLNSERFPTRHTTAKRFSGVNAVTQHLAAGGGWRPGV
jgi:hypothetical protein